MAKEVVNRVSYFLGSGKALANGRPNTLFSCRREMVPRPCDAEVREDCDQVWLPGRLEPGTPQKQH